MIFWQLFYTFLIIGACTFGGGYSMVALIQDQVVVQRGWLTMQEFADLLAVSQTTPGPIGINTATYVGYAATAAAGYPVWASVAGSLLASVAVVLVPVALVLLAGGGLMSRRESPVVAALLRVVRLVVVGLIAAAALGLLSRENFGLPGLNLQFVVSVVIFVAVFALSVWRKVSPVLLMVAAGVVSLIVYSI